MKRYSALALLISSFSSQCSVLHAAAAENNGRMIINLIKAGFNVNYKDANGATPLHYAFFYECDDAAGALLAHGAYPLALDNFGNPATNPKKNRN